MSAWYLDLRLLGEYFDGHQYHHTASPTLFYALHEALRLIHDEGLENRFARHRAASQTLVRGLEGLGLRMHVPEGHRIPHVNTPRVPDGVDDARVRKHLLEKNGIEIAVGRGPLAGKIFRIGLMGPTANEDCVQMFLGKFGEALKACMRVAVTFGKRKEAGSLLAALREAGIEPVRNPESLDSLDGLLLTGGSDINPARYGQDQRGIAMKWTMPGTSLKCACWARRWRPIFRCWRSAADCNCSMWLGRHVGPTSGFDHGCASATKGAEPGKHPRRTGSGLRRTRRLAEIIGGGGLDVNSRHHQAVESAGPGSGCVGDSPGRRD